jgi:hypothetical protein
LNPAIATTAFVLDNSVLCGWILANQATPYSDAIAGLLPVVDAHAPWLRPERLSIRWPCCQSASMPPLPSQPLC